MNIPTLRIRHVTVLIVGIALGASFLPWLRHQHMFWTLMGIMAVALVAAMLFSAVASPDREVRLWRSLPSEKSSWLRRGFRTWWWKVSMVIVLIATVPHFVLTRSDAYKLAVKTARQSPEFEKTLGPPAKEGWFSDGTEEEEGDSGKAELLIPVRGSLRDGKLRVLAAKDNGRWRLEALTLELQKSHEHIDLLSSATSAKPLDVK